MLPLPFIGRLAGGPRDAISDVAGVTVGAVVLARFGELPQLRIAANALGEQLAMDPGRVDFAKRTPPGGDGGVRLRRSPPCEAKGEPEQGSIIVVLATLGELA